MTAQPERDGAGALDIFDYVEPVDSAQRFATNFRDIAAAVLVQVAMDETASPHARIDAARAILSYSDGRPGQARPVTLGAVRTLEYDDKLRLFTMLI